MSDILHRWTSGRGAQFRYQLTSDGVIEVSKGGAPWSRHQINDISPALVREFTKLARAAREDQGN